MVFLGEVDGELANSLALRGEVARVIRMLRPQVILAHDPWKHYRLHPDHREAGLLACDGIVAARDPHFNKEHGLAPHRPDALLLWEAEAPDHVEDVDGFVEHKLRALEAHESQFESTMKAVDGDQLAAFRSRIGERLAGLGAVRRGQRRSVQAHHRPVGTRRPPVRQRANWPGLRPVPGSPANACAKPIHSTADAPVTSSPVSAR